MKSFELYEPTSVKEAVGILAQFGNKAKALAGGIDLVAGIMKEWVQGEGIGYNWIRDQEHSPGVRKDGVPHEGMSLPDALVDLTTIPQLRGIQVDNRGATIGAVTTLAEIVESKELAERFPLLTQALYSAGSPLIRNCATLGGNLNQRPRCWFFRGKDFNCFKKGGDFCFSVSGDNRYHAIIGGEACYMVHPSDTATALLALNAQAKIAGPSGERMVSFDNYFTGPREDILRENILKPEELLVEVFIPTPAPGTKQAWAKLKNRQVYDFAVVSVAAAFTVENDTWKDGRIVLGGVAPVPYRATPVENQLQGKNIKTSIQQAAAVIRTVSRPMSRNAYKVDIAQNMLERTILGALA